ncbi:D-arabinono-1,4-lactone oxidase [Pedococcus sp. 2YAF34]|uniref:D-arabinono-1,4-lactone oxidase n=1 Tax=Pedococcus sp. 2YAF34 TaxID=3233032 RepID=UPI003F9BBD5D
MSTTWTNWGRNQTCHPAQVAVPRDVEELAATVAQASARGVRVKAVGSGHSFTPVATTDGVQVRLDHLVGVLRADTRSGRVTVGAGTPLHVLNPALQALGLALPNLGDIDRQTISGAIATGTHGSGARFQGIASAVTGLVLVLADGSALRCSATEEPEVFAAARVGLGALGVVVEVELQCVPAFRLHAQEHGADLEDVLASVQDDVARHDHVDMHWFPHTDRVLVKHNDRVGEDAGGRPLPAWRATLDDDLLSNRFFEVVNRASTRWPGIVPRLNQLTSRTLSARDYTDDSWRVFCSSRQVRFRESEYAVPRAAVGEVVRALRDWVDRHDVSLPFPVELRFTGADDIWLSTGYERENAYVAVHQYHRMDDGGVFAAFEAIVAEHEGRPHWGKLHTLGSDRLGELYARFGDFRAVRDRLDPGRTFTNDHLRHVLGD